MQVRIQAYPYRESVSKAGKPTFPQVLEVLQNPVHPNVSFTKYQSKTEWCLEPGEYTADAVVYLHGFELKVRFDNFKKVGK